MDTKMLVVSHPVELLFVEAFSASNVKFIHGNTAQI